MGKNKKSKRDMILDSTEKLFAVDGYTNVTLRQIAEDAGVDIPILNYHFKKKSVMLEEVLKRRSDTINIDRLKMLDDARKASGSKPPDVTAIIEALVYPIFKRCFNDGPEWISYTLVMSQAGGMRQFSSILHTLYDPVAHHFLSALRQAIPDANDKDIYWYYNFLLGSLLFTLSNTGRLDLLSDHEVSSSDLKSAYQRFIPFVTQGLCGLIK